MTPEQLEAANFYTARIKHLKELVDTSLNSRKIDNRLELKIAIPNSEATIDKHKGQEIEKALLLNIEKSIKATIRKYEKLLKQI